jgi:Zn-dependent protease
VRTHLRIGRLLGVPIGLNWGVLVVCGLLFWSLAAVSLPAVAPRQPDGAYWFAAMIGVLAFLGSLVGHELGHSFIADRNGVRVVEITLWLFGGVAKLEGDADEPGAEFRIAAAGPAMSGLIAVVGGGTAWLVDALDGNRVLIGLLIWLAAINVVLAVSNLLPAFPLDGGRMLRSVLWRHSGRKAPATRRAAVIGQVLAALMVLGGIALMIWFSVWTGVWTLALGLFLFVAARSEWAASRPRPELMSAPVRHLGRRLPGPLGPSASVAELERVLDGDPRAPLVPLLDDQGAMSAMVPRSSLARIPPAQRGVVPVRSLAEPLWGLPRVAPTDSVDDVIGRLGRGRSWWALVVNGDGVESVLCSEDVDDVVELATA